MSKRTETGRALGSSKLRQVYVRRRRRLSATVLSTYIRALTSASGGGVCTCTIATATDKQTK